MSKTPPPLVDHTLEELKETYGLLELALDEQAGRLVLRFEDRIEHWQHAPPDWPIDGSREALVIAGVVYRPLRLAVSSAVEWPHRGGA
jgi:hypothetical protein